MSVVVVDFDQNFNANITGSKFFWILILSASEIAPAYLLYLLVYFPSTSPSISIPIPVTFIRIRHGWSGDRSHRRRHHHDNCTGIVIAFHTFFRFHSLKYVKGLLERKAGRQLSFIGNKCRQAYLRMYIHSFCGKPVTSNHSINLDILAKLCMKMGWMDGLEKKWKILFLSIPPAEGLAATCERHPHQIMHWPR